jgi:hypothetical protein
MEVHVSFVSNCQKRQFPVSDNSRRVRGDRKERETKAKTKSSRVEAFFSTGEFYTNRCLLVLAAVRQIPFA